MKRAIYAAAVFLTLGIVSFLPAAETAEKKTEPPAKSYVQPIDFSALAERFRALPPRSRALLSLYFQGARRYVLTREDGAFPARGTEHYRNIAERAHGAAVLAALATDWPDDLRERCRRDSAGFVREFVAQFGNDHSFGNKWQSSWWAAEMATAAWFVWDRLDPAVQQVVAEMVVYHADLIAGQQPGARVNLDTEAETVAWNSTILAVAVNMMPKHPHAAKWREAVERYVYTIFATPSDLRDTSRGDEGKTVKDWVVGANIHDDFTLENHGRFHIDYELTCYRFLYYGAAMYRLGGNRVPGAYRHHTWDVYDKVMLPCTDAGKFAVYVSDNDWKRYHAWTESAAVHGYIALMESSPLAAALEEQALREADSYWRAFPEKFSYANPYVCGKAWTPRIADIAILHLLMPPPPEPVSAAQAEEHLRGVHLKPDVNLLTHYSHDGSFRSFYWGPGPTVRHIEPRDNSWMMLPLKSNYGIAIDGKPGPDAGAKVSFRKGADWFWTMRRDARGVDEAFISLPDEIVVSLTAVPGAALKGAKRVDSMVAVEKPHKAFTIYYRGGEATFRYGQNDWDRAGKSAGRNVQSEWVNLADSIGYVVLNLSKDHSCMVLPKPGVRDALSLYHVEGPSHDQCFVTVAFPNEDHHRTEAMAAKVTGAYGNGILSCLAPPYFVWANFSDKAARVELPPGVEWAGQVTCPSKSVGILRMKRDGMTWSPLE